MLVGITGQMGAGKSTLARLLEERGARVIDADQIGHEVLTQPSVKKALAQAFGEEVVGDDGRVDRRTLARCAFADPEAVSRLNRIVGMPLNRELWRRVQRDRGGGERTVVVDAALLIEWGMHERFDAIVVVTTADDETVLERLERSRGLTRSEIARRLEAQSTVAEKLAVADFVVHNDGDLESLVKHAEDLWRELERLRLQRPSATPASP